MANNYLQLNPEKTEVLISAPFGVLPKVMESLGSLSHSVKSTLRNLGVHMGQAFSLDQHVNYLVRNCFYQLRNIAKLRPVVSTVELEMIIHSFISSRLDYCNSLFTCLSNSTLKHLQVVQNSEPFAKLLTKSSKRSHVTPILISLHWLPVKFRIHFKILVMVFRALHGQAPVYINEMLKPYNSSRNLRSSNQILLVVPRSRLKTKGDCAFEVVDPKLWNALPRELRSVDSVDISLVQTCFCLQPQIRKSWDSMENANKKKKVVISKFTLTCISLQTI